MSLAPPLISVVVSFRNEEAVIPELLARLARALAPLPLRYELVFVNDASTDASRALLEAAARQDARVKIVNMSRRFGAVECQVAGLGMARGDAVVLIDADLQDPPSLLPSMIERWQQGFDVVHTQRTNRLGESGPRRAVTTLAYKVLRRMSNIDLLIDAGDFKLLSRRVVDQLLTLPEKDLYLRGLVVWIGYSQTAIPYERQPRFAGRSHFPFLSQGPRRAFMSGFMAFSSIPLVVWLPLGLLVCLGSFAAAVVTLLTPWRLAMPAWGWTALAACFVAGVQFIALGMMGAYLSRVYDDVRRRPRFIIESTVGIDHPAAPPRLD